MPKSLKAYADPWKALAYRNEQRSKNYYGNTAKPRKRTHKSWSEEEDEMVKAHDIPDRELSTLINRTISAIQQRRNELKKQAAIS